MLDVINQSRTEMSDGRYVQREFLSLSNFFLFTVKRNED